MREMFVSFLLMTSLELCKRTSSRALADGRLRCDSSDGRTTSPSGQAPRHANRSAPLVNVVGQKTSVTSRPSGLNLSGNADLQSYLANKLQRLRGATVGWMIYSMHWKVKATPAGRSYCQLVASARRMSASDCSLVLSGYPTPTARDWRSGAASAETLTRNSRPLNEIVEALFGYPTPTCSDATGSDYAYSRGDKSKRVWKLSGVAKLSRGCHSRMAKRGRLNPALSRWLMGYPVAWDACAPTETPSYRKSQRRSSTPSSSGSATKG